MCISTITSALTVKGAGSSNGNTDKQRHRRKKRRTRRPSNT